MTNANQRAEGGARVPRIYPPDLQPTLQALLATLADIDFAFESDLEIIKTSAAEEVIKQQVIARLRDRHNERRAPYLRQVAKLQQQIEALAA